MSTKATEEARQEMQHSPEPWNYFASHLVEDSNKNTVIYDGKFQRCDDEFRAVSCVNACAGMEDPSIVILAHRAALEKAREAIERILTNWPTHRDGMDGEILPVGVKACRVALTQIEEALKQ